jgi:flagellar basal body-associated protein FliL
LKQRKNKTVIIILEILAFILVAAGIFFGTYYLFVGKSSNSYEASVKEYIDKINNINNSMSSFTDGQTIDAQKKIPDKIIDPVKIREELPNKTA